MNNLQKISSNKQNKYDEIIEYLKQDDGYWLENDKWDLTEEFFVGEKVYSSRYINFFCFENEHMKNEVKYYTLYLVKENYIKKSYLLNLGYRFSSLGYFLKKYYKDRNSFNEIIEKELFLLQWKSYLITTNITTEKSLNYCNAIISPIYDFISDFYDNREETEKDIWHAKNIKGVKISATQERTSKCLDFTRITKYYRETVKRYFRTMITKKSFNHCRSILLTTDCFFSTFYEMGYSDGFLKQLTRQDIEKYLYNISNKYKDKNVTYTNKFIAYPRTFLEYIQMAQYDESPVKEVAFLMFENDIPKRERDSDRLNRVKFIPEPILKQFDNNIMDLDRPEYIPIYILLRETGWRGADILNLRYNNCLEQIWNNKEEEYNYYLCGEITKTGIALLKIPIRDKVAEMVRKSIAKAKELSTECNNPKRYLFNNYEGKLKGNPLAKQSLLHTIKRLIEQKDIKDVNDKLYHFKIHALRHTRAKEYVEQGMGISIIQQILGHQSLQMTVHYATVTENTLYEKWKATEDLDLFRVNSETHKLQQVALDSDDRENLIRYEYVKKNLDAVKVPFGVCFKPSKLPCKQQMNHCLTCASFCTTIDNIAEYEEEIEQVKKQIEISKRCGRELWAEKNKGYLKLLEDTLEKIKEHKLVHKNGNSREEL